LAIAYLPLCQPSSGAQSLAPNPETQNVDLCAPSITGRQPSGPKVTIADLYFEGELGMPPADVEQIASALRQQTYSGEPDEVVDEVLERARRAWQDHGYFKVQVHGARKMLTSSPGNERVAITVLVEAGQQYRLEDIQFNNNKEVTSVKALRSLFPLKDGEIFDRSAISKGLDNLRFAYGQLGHLNFSSIPNAQVNEERQTISLIVDVDEGKKFFITSLKTVGLEDANLNDSLLKPGNIYDKRLVDLLFEKYKPSSLQAASADSRISEQIDEKAGTVAITFDFRPCPLQQ
jgi:outer membrane protein assembly factor BamA